MNRLRKALFFLFLLLFCFSLVSAEGWRGGSVGDLVIESDESVYHGATSSVVTLKVQNLQSVDRLTDLAVLFEDKWANDSRVRVEWIKVLQENVPYQVPVRNCEDLACAFTYDENTDLNGSVSRYYYCTDSKKPCSYDSLTDSCSYQECTKSWTTKYHDVWQPIPLTEPKNLSSKVNYKEWNGKKFHARKGTKAFKDLGKVFKKNDTVYLQLKISYPINTSGEFAIATEGAFLDPWWDSDWSYKRAIEITNSVDYNKWNVIKVSSLDFSTWGIQCTDLNDVIIVDENANIDLNRITEGTTTSTDGNIYFELANGLPAGTYNTQFYVYYGNTNCPAPKKDTYKGQYDTFEDGDYTSNPEWTITEGTGAEVQSTVVKNGSYAFHGSGDTGIRTAYSGTYTDGDWIGAWFRVTLLGVNGSMFVMEDSTPSMLTTTRVLSGTLNVYASAGYVALDGSPSISVDTWYYQRFKRNGANDWSVELLDGSESVIAYKYNFTPYADGTLANIRLHSDADSGDTYWDDVTYKRYLEPTISLGAEETSNTAPSVVLVQPNGVDGNYLSGTQGIVFDVNDADIQSNADGNLWIDIYYSSTQNGFSNAIVSDGNLFDTSLFSCSDTNFSTTQTCTYSWDTTAIADGNYFIDLNVHDDSDANSIDSSDASFMIDNTAPTTTDDHNAGWQTIDQNVHLTCSDGTGSGCSITQYRIDSGAWQDYNVATGILFTTDGNFQLDYNSTDVAGNIETTNSVWVAVDKTRPILYLEGCDYTDWNNTNQSCTLTCTDGSGSGCANTYYRLDTNAFDGNTMGSWTTGTTFTITADGNWQVDFNAIDVAGWSSLAGNDYNTQYILIDTNQPWLSNQYPVTDVLYGTLSTPTLYIYPNDQNTQASYSNVKGCWAKIYKNDVLVENNYWIDLNSDGWCEYTYSGTNELAEDHWAYITFWAMDNADNNSATITTGTYYHNEASQATGGAGGGGGGSQPSTETIQYLFSMLSPDPTKTIFILLPKGTEKTHEFVIQNTLKDRAIKITPRAIGDIADFVTFKPELLAIDANSQGTITATFAYPKGFALDEKTKLQGTIELASKTMQKKYNVTISLVQKNPVLGIQNTLKKTPAITFALFFTFTTLAALGITAKNQSLKATGTIVGALGVMSTLALFLL